ncbi:peptidase A4 family-domain-containing protein [Xylariales sp. PMI_506]|nr:peptidase A4 family-domain-containing protein [Xylariales sp. PMI_506]
MILATLLLAWATLTSAEVSFNVKAYDNGVEIPYVDEGIIMGDFGTRLNQRLQNAKAKGTGSSVSVSSNWCGSVAQTTTKTFQSVSGQWVVPTLTLRDGQTDSDNPSVAQWVGIDGDGCASGALIQGGTLSTIESSGTQKNIAWTEMLPAALKSITLTVNTGDSITTNVTMTSTTSGTVAINNLTTGKSVVGTLSGGATLCGTSAEWILEDITSGSLVPFAAFPKSTFTNNEAIFTDGSSTTADGAGLIEIQQSGATLCSATEANNVITTTDS